MNMAVASPPEAFRGHCLDEQMQARLMNRVDTKFLVPAHLLDACLRGLEHHYSILEIGGNRRCTLIHRVASFTWITTTAS